MEIKYQSILFNETDILNLYLKNEWYAYTNDKERLFKGIKNSLDIIGAYDDEVLVGLIRTIGDQETIIYIQDILVLPEYQRLKIGTTLIQLILDKYTHVRQIVLMTDPTEKTDSFYRQLGFVTLKDKNCVGYSYLKK